MKTKEITILEMVEKKPDYYEVVRIHKEPVIKKSNCKDPIIKMCMEAISRLDINDRI